MRLDLSATLSQIFDQLFARLQLPACRLTPIEIADQTDAERDVVEVITMHVATVDLPPPAVAYLDLPVTGGSAVADDEMVGKPVLHATHPTMIIIKDTRTSLPGAAVVHDDELPASPHYRRAIDLAAD